jgi:hypothetical protein
MVLLLALPQVQAAGVIHATTTSSSLSAMSLSCTNQGESGCVNVAATITQDGTGGGRFCVDVGDFRETAHPPVAHGCVDLSPGQLTVGDTQISVPDTAVPAVYSADCYLADPADGCVPGNVTLDASATFTVNGPPTDQRTMVRDSSGPCPSTQWVTDTTANVTGSVTIDSVAYDLSGAGTSVHTFQATLVRETIRSIVKCKG